MNLLLTSVGRRKYLVDYFQEVLEPNDRIYGCDANDLAPALVSCDKSFCVPKYNENDYCSAIERIVIDFEIDYIFPLNDFDIEILASLDSVIIRSRLVSTLPKLVSKTLNKGAFNTLLSDHEILVPRTFFNVDSALNSDCTNFVVKPVKGSGSFATFISLNRDNLQIYFDYCNQLITALPDIGSLDNVPIIQEFINGEEYGLDIVNSVNREFLDYAVKKKIHMRSGETDSAYLVKDDQSFRDLAASLSKITSHIGLVDVDIIKSKNRLFVIDVNPRFGGGYPFTHESGINFVKLIVELLRGKSFNDINYRSLQLNYSVMSKVISVINVEV